MNIKEKLLTQNPLSLMFELAVPAVIGMTVIGLYPFVDGIFAGHILGEKAMSAISIAMPLTFLNNGIATLIGIGSASILARALGKGEQTIVDAIMGNLIFWVLLFSLVTTVTGILLASTFLQLIGATPDITALGVRYLRILFLGSLFVNFAQSANMVMRGEGRMRTAMLIMGLGAFLNIILDPIFMILMGDKGIEGAAIATLISQIISAAVTLYYFKAKSKNVPVKTIRPNTKVYLQMFSIGASAMVMQLFFMVQHSLLYKTSFQYGGEANGILMAASLRLFGFAFIPLWGISQGLQPLVGTNFGAQQFQRVKEGMRVFMGASLILATVFWLPAEVFPAYTLKLFNVSDTIIESGSKNFQLFFSVFFLYGIMVLTVTFFQSIGDAKKASLLVMFRQLIIFVPAILWLPENFGISGVWVALPLVDFIMIVVGLWMQEKELKKMLQTTCKEVKNN